MITVTPMLDRGDPVEHRGRVVRVWKDVGQRPSEPTLDPDEPHIVIPRHTLPALLGTVEQDLAGFLTALHPWAWGTRAGLAGPLVAAVDRRLQISAPLGI